MELIFFLKFICGILNRGVANSFWNYVIQISSRQLYFQDIFESVKSKSIYWKYVLIKIKYIFLRDSYVCTRWIFIFDSDQAQINRVRYFYKMFVYKVKDKTIFFLTYNLQI